MCLGTPEVPFECSTLVSIKAPSILGFYRTIGIMEKKMETTIMGYIGIIEYILEKKMETTIVNFGALYYPNNATQPESRMPSKEATFLIQNSLDQQFQTNESSPAAALHPEMA